MGSPVRVGPAGWSYPDWEGRVYPRPKPRGFDPLAYLASYLDLIEINASFYSPPRPEHAQRWAARVAAYPEFRFVAKLYQGFTHGPLPDGYGFDRSAREYLAGVAPLRAAGRLQALLVQFPLSFTRTRTSRLHLARLVERFGEPQSDGLPLVLEFRHASWFEPDVLDRFRTRGLSVASIDLPATRHHPPKQFEVTGALGYLRLHGRNQTTWFDPAAGRDQRYDYLYAERELDEITTRAQRLADETDQTLVVTNNHFGGQAVANALEIAQRLKPGSVELPSALVQAFPHLASLGPVRAPAIPPDSGPEAQGELF